MKANELKVTDLMVGDWVSCQINGIEVKYVRIASLNKTTMNGIPSDFIEFDKVMIDMLHGSYYQVDVASIHPIPLTSEILKKNGLANDPYGCHFKEDEYMMLEISVEEEGIYWTINYNEYGVLKLKYVHQLQHALRLCGINKEIVV